MMERDDELEMTLDDEVQLEVDEAVAASEDDGSIVPSGVAFLPLVPLREIVIFPEMVAPLKVGRDKTQPTRKGNKPKTTLLPGFIVAFLALAARAALFDIIRAFPQAILRRARHAGRAARSAPC